MKPEMALASSTKDLKDIKNTLRIPNKSQYHSVSGENTGNNRVDGAGQLLAIQQANTNNKSLWAKNPRKSTMEQKRKVIQKLTEMKHKKYKMVWTYTLDGITYIILHNMLRLSQQSKEEWIRNAQ